MGWFIPHLGVSQVATFLLHLKTPVTVPLGKVLYLSGRVPLNGDVYTTNNTARGTVRVLGSFDPNDKQVTPERVTDVQVDTSELTYVIRFQNTGNFPADFVVILDTLSKALDLSTFQVLSASQPFTWRLHEGRLLEVRFDNNLLPDSTSNEPGSHGFVAFSVYPEKGLTVGDSIPNRAGIYFDYNPPVITNTSVMRVAMVSAIRELFPKQQACFRFVPQPCVNHRRGDHCLAGTGHSTCKRWSVYPARPAGISSRNAHWATKPFAARCSARHLPGGGTRRF